MGRKRIRARKRTGPKGFNPVSADFNQQPKQQTYLKRKPQPYVRSTQQLASESCHTLSGSTATPKEAIEVDPTDEVLNVKQTNEAIVVDLTKEVTEVESTNEVIEVNTTNAAELLTTQPSILSDTSPDLWHKVTVKPAGGDRVAVLYAINRQISPRKLIPYFYCMEDGHITFLVKNCSAALTALFKQNLQVQYGPTKIELKVELRAKKVNLSAILRKIISERLSSDGTFLDLSHLTSIPEFQQVMYDPSENVHLQQQLLKTGEMFPNVVSLSLAGNGLFTLSHLATVFADKLKWCSLKVLDLTDNKITTTSDLAIFSSIPIRELYLNKNAVCGKHRNDETYISVIRVNFPHLIKLDGAYLQRTPGLPRWRPNYIFCRSGGNSGELADQFLEHFFTLYDGDDRTWLWELYHEDAYFSLSSMYLPDQSTSRDARLSSYIAECRNLLHTSAKLRSKTALAHGAEKVVMRLEKLPRTRHDPYSFTVDLLHDSDKSTILTVTGVFKEQNPKQKTSPRHFMRTFVLVRRPNGEYQIANDIMYVTNATTDEAEDAFRFTKPNTNLKKIRPPREVTESDKNSMTEKYSQLTNMTSEWSHRCLETAHWDLRKALLSFIEMYKAGKIPVERFIKAKEAAKS
ncbi:nuclear RNA export factor 1-like [Schistocerca gregaria]|uniref:nuclear RNA export factor 1-like n=1 Tax=Schistocerca gregaria TaxID=7010 RepID=UPI00211EF0E1|nr:nuclear RNA export factor 1-like [Schistocerca gregaria]